MTAFRTARCQPSTCSQRSHCGLAWTPISFATVASHCARWVTTHCRYPSGSIHAFAPSLTMRVRRTSKSNTSVCAPRQLSGLSIATGLCSVPGAPASRGPDSHRGRCTLYASAPACPPVSYAALPHGAVSSHSNRPPDARAPAPPGPRSPHPRLARRRGHHACRQRPTRHATPWAGPCCPAGQEHHPTSAHTAFYPSRSRIRGGT